MRVYHYAPLHFEPWDWRTPDETGIGGSETCVCETAKILAARGHDVTAYAPLRDGCPEEGPGGAKWLPLEVADFSAPGLWVLHRCPAALDQFPEPHPGQTTWLVCQDVFYPPQLPDGLTPERSARLDRCLPLCQAQERFLLEKSPELAGKTTLSSNGIRLDLMDEVEKWGDCPYCLGSKEDNYGDHYFSRETGGPCPECGGHTTSKRDPYKIIYTSSPDRGLIPLLKIFKRALEWEPRLSLTAAYGFDNIDRCKGPYWKRVKAECESLMSDLGDRVTWLGRLPQEALYSEYLSAGLWVYPTDFTETSCISCMEAQALGAVPITNPLWALADNVRHGVFLAGGPNEPLVQAAYVGEILRLTRDLDLQEKIRAGMIPWARQRFTWERVVDQWEALAGGYTDRAHIAQYAYQIRHAVGKVLNVGSNIDFARFGRNGGVNLDINTTDPLTGLPLQVDVVADARDPLPFGREFDTVILGDILEHLTDAEAVACLKNARVVLKDGGRVLVTCPEDRRPPTGRPEYAPGIPGDHPRPVTSTLMNHWLREAGLDAVRLDRLDYGFCFGWAAVAEPVGVPEPEGVLV